MIPSLNSAISRIFSLISRPNPTKSSEGSEESRKNLAALQQQQLQEIFCLLSALQKEPAIRADFYEALSRLAFQIQGLGESENSDKVKEVAQIIYPPLCKARLFLLCSFGQNEHEKKACVDALYPFLENSSLDVIQELFAAFSSSCLEEISSIVAHAKTLYPYLQEPHSRAKLLIALHRLPPSQREAFCQCTEKLFTVVPSSSGRHFIIKKMAALQEDERCDSARLLPPLLSGIEEGSFLYTLWHKSDALEKSEKEEILMLAARVCPHTKNACSRLDIIQTIALLSPRRREEIVTNERVLKNQGPSTDSAQVMELLAALSGERLASFCVTLARIYEGEEAKRGQAVIEKALALTHQELSKRCKFVIEFAQKNDLNQSKMDLMALFSPFRLLEQKKIVLMAAYFLPHLASPGEKVSLIEAIASLPRQERRSIVITILPLKEAVCYQGKGDLLKIKSLLSSFSTLLSDEERRELSSLLTPFCQQSLFFDLSSLVTFLAKVKRDHRNALWQLAHPFYQGASCREDASVLLQLLYQMPSHLAEKIQTMILPLVQKMPLVRDRYQWMRAAYFIWLSCSQKELKKIENLISKLSPEPRHMVIKNLLFPIANSSLHHRFSPPEVEALFLSKGKRLIYILSDMDPLHLHSFCEQMVGMYQGEGEKICQTLLLEKAAQLPLDRLANLCDFIEKLAGAYQLEKSKMELFSLFCDRDETERQEILEVASHFLDAIETLSNKVFLIDHICQLSPQVRKNFVEKSVALQDSAMVQGKWNVSQLIN